MPLTRVALFGSYARGNYTVASDIDLLVVYSGQSRGDVFAAVKRFLDVRGLEPHVYTEDEYHQLRDTIERMVRDGVEFSPGPT